MSHPLQPTDEQFLTLAKIEQLTPIKVTPLFTHARNWQERYRQLMLLGKLLPTLSDEFRVEPAQVKGCESQAWLYHKEIEGKHYFIADSDTRIVKGLIALLLCYAQGKTTKQIADIDFNAYLDQFGLTDQLSPSRTNGLFALAKAIKSV